MGSGRSMAAQWRLGTAFLDRDGTINRKAPEGDYVKSWSEFEFLPGAPEAIVRLSRAGLRLVVVTNQRGIALGKMTTAGVGEIHDRMLTEIRRAGGHIDAVFFCPHGEGHCDCRKPDTGMFLQARRAFPEIEFARSAMIGDSWRDMEAARRIGARRVWLGPRAEPARPGETGEGSDLSVASLAECAAVLTGDPGP